MKTFKLITLILIFIGIVAFAIFQLARKEGQADECIAAGGVPIRGKYEVICLKQEAILKL